MKCPKCLYENSDNSKECLNCGFDIALYNEAYQRIYNNKLNKLERAEKQTDNPPTNGYAHSVNSVHRPRCPYCNSKKLTRITSVDKVVNIAMFGLLGNKRKYQWHCNNCNTNFYGGLLWLLSNVPNVQSKFLILRKPVQTAVLP